MKMTDVALNKLIEYCEHADLDDDDIFRQLFVQATYILNKDNKRLGTLLSVAHPTIGRWKNGLNLPHRLGRRGIIDLLINEIRKEKNP